MASPIGDLSRAPQGRLEGGAVNGSEWGLRFSQRLKRRLFGCVVPWAVVLALVPIVGPARAGDKEVAWKPIEQALLRVDDQPVKNWNVYEESKKGDPLLLAMGNRFLLIEIHDHKIFELAPAKVEHKGCGPSVGSGGTSRRTASRHRLGDSRRGFGLSHCISAGGGEARLRRAVAASDGSAVHRSVREAQRRRS